MRLNPRVAILQQPDSVTVGATASTRNSLSMSSSLSSNNEEKFGSSSTIIISIILVTIYFFAKIVIIFGIIKQNIVVQLEYFLNVSEDDESIPQPASFLWCATLGKCWTVMFIMWEKGQMFFLKVLILSRSDYLSVTIWIYSLLRKFIHYVKNRSQAIFLLPQFDHYVI